MRQQREFQHQQQLEVAEIEQRYQIERQQIMARQHQIANAVPDLRYSDSIETGFTDRMGNLGVKTMQQQEEGVDDHVTGDKYKSPKYKQFKQGEGC